MGMGVDDGFHPRLSYQPKARACKVRLRRLLCARSLCRMFGLHELGESQATGVWDPRIPRILIRRVMYGDITLEACSGAV